MRICYIANIRFPTERAHGIQVAAMARALAEEGHAVTLVLPDRKTAIAEDAYTYYRLPEEVRIVRMPHLDTTGLGRAGFLFQYAQFALVSGLYFLINARRWDAVLSRDYACCIAPLVLCVPVAWETHRGERNALVRLLIRGGLIVIAITEGLAALYRTETGIPEDHMLVAPDGVAVDEFSLSEGQEDSRRALGLPHNQKIALYAGHLYPWKGADVLARALPQLPEEWLAVFVGGTDADIAAFRERHQQEARIKVLGRKLHAEIPRYLNAADVLVLPNTAASDLSRLYTSPLKLFEYMASGRPIVVSDLPSMREVLDERTAAFVPAGDPDALAAAIVRARPETGSAAREEARQYDWRRRARTVAGFLASFV